MPPCHSSAGAWTGATCFTGAPTRSACQMVNHRKVYGHGLTPHSKDVQLCLSCLVPMPQHGHWPIVGNLGSAACALGHDYAALFFAVLQQEGLLSDQPGCRPTVTTGSAKCCKAPGRDCTRSMSCSPDLVLASLRSVALPSYTLGSRATLLVGSRMLSTLLPHSITRPTA